MALLPRPKVGEQQRFHVIPQGPTDPEHQMNLLRSRAVPPVALIRSTRDLIQVPADGPQLRDRPLEGQQLFPRQRGQ